MSENEEKQAAPASQEGASRGDRGGETRGARGGRGGERGGDRGGDRSKGRGKPRRDKEEPAAKEFNEVMIDVFRCSATVKGGRRLSFGSLVVVGDGKGRVGIGYGKAKEVPGAFQKATKKARRELKRYNITKEGTIPHQVKGVFGASEVVMVPARPGTGLIAGPAVKAVLEAAGYHNMLTKCYGSTNSRNLVKAVVQGLGQLRDRQMVEALRGVTL